MQAYGAAFARAYDRKRGYFAENMAGPILGFYESLPIAQRSRRLLDVGCGTGQLARAVLERGYEVTGVDLSEPMLVHARENNKDFVAQGKASFIHADASDFTVPGKFGFATATFDAVNHIEGIEAVSRAFACVRRTLEDGGVFIFDVQMAAGSKRWARSVMVEDSDEALFIVRGVYDDRRKVEAASYSGFVRVEGGLFERFEEVVYKYIYEAAVLKKALTAGGFTSVKFLSTQTPGLEIEQPEHEDRVFVVAGV